MNKVFVLVIAVAVFLSCKKDISNSNVQKEMIGIWELEKNICGECTTQVTTFSQGNGYIIVFAANGIFEKKMHDTLLFSGTYTLQEKEDCYEREANLTISTNESSNTFSGNYITIEDGKLTFSTPNCYPDEAISIYRRIE